MIICRLDLINYTLKFLQLVLSKVFSCMCELKFWSDQQASIDSEFWKALVLLSLQIKLLQKIWNIVQDYRIDYFMTLLWCFLLFCFFCHYRAWHVRVFINVAFFGPSKNSNRFGMTWKWQNDRNVIFGWPILLISKKLNKIQATFSKMFARNDAHYEYEFNHEIIKLSWMTCIVSCEAMTILFPL